MAQGYSTSRTIAGATTNATLVKPSPGTLNGWSVSVAAAYAVFVKFYDSATIPTAGSGTPKLTLGFPAASVDSTFMQTDNIDGVFFANGIGFTITKLVADNDTTVLVANDCVVNLFYR